MKPFPDTVHFRAFTEAGRLIDLYADYERLNNTTAWHHERSMIKGFVAYTTPAFTVGVKAFINHGEQDVIGIKTLQRDTISANSKAVSVFVKGVNVKDKLGFFTRLDSYSPDVNYDNRLYTSYKGLTGNYEPNNKELFFTARLDFTPVKNVHFIPNVWYNRYTSNQAYRDHDLVCRMTFYFVYR